MAKSWPHKTSNEYGEKTAGVKEVPKPSKMTPAAKATIETYDPQGSGQEHDAFMRSVAPGITDTGNMEHKWGEPGAHWTPEEPPSDLAGD
jgi:hypothetical protein